MFFNLCKSYIHLIEHTNNVILYKLGNQYISSNIRFSNANTVTLINCSKEGIFNILTPYIFPNITHINYLSLHPGNYNIYKRFGERDIRWTFPDKDYHFYTYMEVLNKGSKSNTLIHTYIKNKKLIDINEDTFNVLFTCDIDIPDYKIVSGEWYKQQFDEYCKYKIEEIKLLEDKELS
jgi:hypothetical protein